MITLLTTTGDRGEAFALCRKWMQSQTIQPEPIQWLVIDDGFTPMSDDLKEGVDYIRRVPSEGEGHTLIANLRVAVEYIKGDKILIIEDDDWYGPNYVKTMSELLNKYDLVGEGQARYYILPVMKYRRIGNVRHASFCQTGFNKSVIPDLISVFNGDPYIDSRLWSLPIKNKHIFLDGQDNLKLHCSVKGLKGRKGIGTGHCPDSSYYMVDDKLTMLRKWVGVENAKVYMDHVGQSYRSALLIEGKSKLNHREIKPINNGSDITVITCTGDRPESFNKLRIWMSKQTLQPQQWLVIDDGEIPLTNTDGFEYYRREPKEKDYEHTLCLNLDVALDKVKCGKILFMEDDDWYHSTYINYMSKLLDKADLVGFKDIVFYHFPTSQYMIKGSAKQPALSQTGINSKYIPILKEIIKEAPKEFNLCGKGLVDSFLWNTPLELTLTDKAVKLTVTLKTAKGIIPSGTIFNTPVPYSILRRAERNNGAVFLNSKNKVMGTKLALVSDKYISVSMKGLPGRRGLTSHHNENNAKYKKDVDYTFLKSIIKEDFLQYLK